MTVFARRPTFNVRDWLFYETCMEIFISSISVMLNVYFTIRINQLSTFSPNFRLMMTVQSFLTCLITCIHPLEYILPPRLYSVEAGNIGGAIVFYSLVLIQHWATFVFESKYALIAIERVIAYKERSTYEHRDSTLSRQIMTWFSSVCAVLLALKTYILWGMYDDELLDVRLRRSTMIGRSYGGYCINYVIATLSTIVAIYFFVKLHYELKNNREHHSLSESFEIRQTRFVLLYVRRLVGSFIGLLIACGSGVYVITYLKFYKNYTEDDPEIVVVYTFMFISLCMYNLVSMLFMISSFPQLQRAVMKDWPFLERARVVDLPYQTETVQDTELYFKQIQDAWK